MPELKLLLPFLLLTLNINSDDQPDSKVDCDLIGSWNQVTLLIEPLGEMHELIFEKENFSEENFSKYAQLAHNIYTSGQGNMDLSDSVMISFSKNKIYYNKEKLGKYKTADDCSNIKLNRPFKKSSEVIDKFTLLHRYENIIVLQQGKQINFYLRRYPDHPFFVGISD